ncbi:hypothetical protein GOBAR_AA03000 [Gossypium barbadense]|uniref:Uncharacterized protein n=1 Tax=Gossypium barbadense TaxID=3634 RepID=A0A2P5YPT4_GOSBA|nr:hypothetical protein GOBAR_AA03000 [Gossypium barbadense]
MDLLIPTTAPLLAEPSSGIIRFFPQASLLNSLQLTFPTGEVEFEKIIGSCEDHKAYFAKFMNTQSTTIGSSSNLSPPGKPKKENNEALENFKVETKANMKNYLPNLKSNLMLHTQVVVDPFDVSQIDFNWLHKLTNSGLDIVILCPSGAEWKEFQKK